ncbi:MULTISPECIES: N-acetylglucosamine kinase [unclassified Cryobacterium]|uniref:N-acetylglucosamine kinase n=1 Tax=unclassified Cryobacterium TaxID=2649013 RepID=UPI002AB5AF82|nr:MULTISPECIES: BadF/BadG/BcrA/BcrD ATPase family protein [unclassified Cryobacterium]MDY7543540.1 BadF/BadG/BcrA/BcrD ATPase family protein [Cryobacterium sp. 5B3]MEA9999185.1 BadF/BadG/BcrA/BcrD ATPase family protein [Cryobacterium sp. RTS3]MEB0273102.1 BadF/BadG/BcrA/BcrD ATPase family protein [Cryobacterium sp. 5B3]
MTDVSRSLTIDAGQTGIRALLRSADGRHDTFDFAGIRTDRELMPQLADVVKAVAATESGLSDDLGIRTLSAGISGFTQSDADAAELRHLTHGLGVQDVFLAHDSVTSYLGALGDTPGAVIAVGTGVVTLAVGVGAVARVDGWGYLIADAGSGYWLGRAALDSVMRDYDGRGQVTALRNAVQKEFPNLETLYLELQADPARVSRIAAWSRSVTALAPTDAVAAAICDAAAAELALSVRTGLERVGQSVVDAPVIGGLGGVLRSPEIATRFERDLRLVWPAADIRFPTANGLDGAALLPNLPATSAVLSLVARSRA